MPSPDDEDISFKEAMAGCKWLNPEHPNRYTSKPKKLKTHHRHNAGKRVNGYLSTDPANNVVIDETEIGQSILFVRSGLQKAMTKKLKRGELYMDERLDLHGLRGWEAEQALERFIIEARVFRYQTVLIIHGKGLGSQNKYGVLKPLTIKFLKSLSEVLAFCSAQPKDGGTGSMYVLLKKH